MRILHSADWHLGLTRFGNPTATGNSRAVDLEATLGRFVDVAREHKPDLTIFAGDTFNTRQATPETLALFARTLRDLRDAGTSSVVIPGNHDGMTAIGHQNSHALRWLAELHTPDVWVLMNPGVYPMAGVRVVAMPYPHKRAFDLELATLDPQDRVLEAGRRLSNAVREMVAGLGGILVFVGHLSVHGARTGSEASLMRMGWDVLLDADVLEPFHYAALGHIHRQQQVGPHGWYAGSPEYVDFGELGQPKGWLLADISPLGTTVSAIASGARRLERLIVMMEPTGDLSCDWTGAGDGPILNLHIVGHRQPRAADVARIQRMLRERGASYVHTTRDIADDRPAPTPAANAETDVLAATEHWLRTGEHPIEPTMALARELVAQQA